MSDAGFLLVDAFFELADDDHCLAPNLEPHPTLQAMQSQLADIQGEAGVQKILVGVVEYDDNIPLSDCVFISGEFEPARVVEWANVLSADYYQVQPGERGSPVEMANDKSVWCIVWD